MLNNRMTEFILYIPYRDNIYREENGKFTETSYVATITNAKLSGNTNEKLNVYYDNILINTGDLIALDDVNKVTFIQLCKETIFDLIFGNL